MLLTRATFLEAIVENVAAIAMHKGDTERAALVQVTPSHRGHTHCQAIVDAVYSFWRSWWPSFSADGAKSCEVWMHVLAIDDVAVVASTIHWDDCLKPYSCPPYMIFTHVKL